MAVDVEAHAGPLLKLLGEPLRWEIAGRLAVEDLCTCHLTADLGAAQPLVSHHLSVLRQAGVLRSEREGAFTYHVLEQHWVVSRLADVLGELATAPGDRQRRPCP